MLVNLCIQEKNRLTKSQNPATIVITIMEILVENFTPNLEVMKDVKAEPVTVVTKEAKLLIVYQLVEQTIPNLLIQRHLLKF